MKEDKLQAMLDDFEIRKVLYRYTRGVDRLDAAMIRSVYHEKSTDDHGTYKGSGADFGDYVVKALAENTEATMHSLNQSIIEVDGDDAQAETYFVAYHVRLEGGDEYLDRFGGRYLDRLRRHFGQWRIDNRVVVRDWSTTDKIEESHYKREDFVNGRRDKEDLAYKGV